MTTLASMLLGARRALLAAAYQHQYMAMTAAGKACSPMLEGAALSYSGALIAGSGGGQRHTELVRWLNYHHLLPRREPRTKEQALALVDEGLALLGVYTDEAA